MWNQKSLGKAINDNFDDALFVIVSNREPYAHYRKNGQVRARRTVGGVSITFDSILKATKGLWVAYGGSEADKDAVDENNEVKLPPGNPRYTLRRVWMTKKELDGYYTGFSNEALWPLCHVAFVEPQFRESDWREYKKINKRFAKEILAAIGSRKAVVWIQDYHFALLPYYLKQGNPNITVGHFWHIPWPTYETFRLCPWRKEILRGLLASDLIGFHRYYQTNNFLITVSRELEAIVDFDARTIQSEGHTTQVIAQPISVDAENILNRLNERKDDKSAILASLEKRPPLIAVGVDRLDYSKGIKQRFVALRSFFAQHPEYIGKLSYVGVATPTRTDVPAYQAYAREIEALAESINEEFGTDDWKPIYLRLEFIDRNEVMLLLREADLCLVTSIDDGMNLVAKEFVISNSHGALILSEFTGAAKDLGEAFLINPYDTQGIVASMKRALELPLKERKERLAIMHKRVHENNLFRWAGKFLTKLAEQAQQRTLE